MLRKHASLLFFLSFLCATIPVFGQQLTQGKDETGKDLLKALGKATRIPRSSIENGESFAFALKFIFAEGGKIDTILPSKYAPKEMKQSLTQRGQYKDVNWEGIFKRKVKNKDALIVPVSIYDPVSTSQTFHEYNVDDLFNFSFPGEGERFVNCLIMQTFVIHYGKPKS
ncbi:hypothetical protein F0L74_29125 [Chitinophaga agrisoli]|uniref:Uncharacterized protein n=1 Tax=Chitinophaga agrisoli TaxID=2607653 RepID=A0A5B2VNH1_9BACT|nr:hypothetical protein [Chitinophaga agrisoli]KAA2240230.1 hypothetical protein F0L74_29125 [Chitinophaga agrisoli]